MRRLSLQGVMLAALLAPAITACDGDSGMDPAAAAGAKLTVTTNPTFGPILADESGSTLYIFSKDVPGTGASACTGDCLSKWPVFHGDSVGEGLDAAALGSFERADGAAQSTYKGWPLYYFAGDETAGDTKGDGVNGIWYVAPAPFYDVVVRNDAALGNLLTDAAGRTLYYFAKDVPADGDRAATSSCVDGCLDIWPVFHVDASTVPSSLDPAELGEITRVDGTKQSTYKGWPLYYFASDAAPGDTAGDGVKDVWFVVPDPFYTVLLMSDAEVGSYLATPEGETIYRFTNDTIGDPPTSACTSATCLDNWPLLQTDAFRVPSSLDPAEFGTFTRADGEVQTTHRGAPLYLYAGDGAAGDLNGQGVNDVWFALTPFEAL